MPSFQQRRFNLGQLWTEFGNNFLYNIRIKKRPTADPNASLEGQTAIITGGNKGIGGAITRDLVSRGCRVIIASRDVDQANQFANELNENEKKNANSKGGEVVVKGLDLASADSIRAFVNEVSNSCDKIDILINNAGVISPIRTEVSFDMENANPFEFTIAVNYFGAVLLTLLLVEFIEKSKDPRILFISSQAYLAVDRLRLNDLHFKYLGGDPYDRMRVYAHSKLALMSFIKIFAEGLYSLKGIPVFAVDPGSAITGMTDQLTCCLKCLISGPMKPFLRNLEGSANSAIMCVFSDKDKYDPKDFYFTDGKAWPLGFSMNDESALQTLWGITKETLSMHYIMDSLNVKKKDTEV